MIYISKCRGTARYPKTTMRVVNKERELNTRMISKQHECQVNRFNSSLGSIHDKLLVDCMLMIGSPGYFYQSNIDISLRTSSSENLVRI